MKDTAEKQVTLITGASSGIGRALAEAMARQGYDVAIFGRRSERLEELKSRIEQDANRRVVAAACDIRDAAKMRKHIMDVQKQLGRIDVVVSNAGFTIPGSFESLNVEDYRNIFDTNFMGMLNTLYPALPALKESGGTVVVVGSILGEFGIMDRSAYVSTKFALRGFYESVRYELKEQGIACLLVEPGFVKTELRYMDKKGNRLKTVSDRTKKKTSHGMAVPPEKVAEDIMRGLPKQGFRKRITTGHAKVFAFLNWLCPGLLAALVYRNRHFIRTKIVK